MYTVHVIAFYLLFHDPFLDDDSKEWSAFDYNKITPDSFIKLIHTSYFIIKIRTLAPVSLCLK